MRRPSVQFVFWLSCGVVLWTSLSLSGDRGLAIPSLSQAAYADAGSSKPEAMYEPAFRSGTPSDVLLSGPPTLARGHLHAFVDLLEAAFELSLTQAAEQALRDALETEYESFGSGERETFIESVSRLPHIKDSARAGEREAVTQGLNAFRLSLDGRLRRAPARESSRVIEAALARRGVTAWPGDPAVNGSAADAWMELGDFLLRLATNEAQGPTPGQVGALQQDLREEFRARSSSERMILLDAHRTWLRVKAAWDNADSAAHTRMRWGAVKLLNDLLPEGQRLALVEGVDLPSYAREARRLKQGRDRYQCYGLLIRNPARVRPMLETAFGLQGEGAAYAFLFRTTN